MKKRRHKWVRWYFGDHRADFALQCVSFAARGLWMEMLWYMDGAPNRGFMAMADGTPLTDEHIARVCGCSPREGEKLIRELEEHKVFSRNERGAIYNRRMVRDETKLRRWLEHRARNGRSAGKRPRLPIPKSVRRSILHGASCAYCGETAGLDVDHKVPVSLGGTDEPENLQPLCWRCNVAKGNRWKD